MWGGHPLTSPDLEHSDPCRSYTESSRPMVWGPGGGWWTKISWALRDSLHLQTTGRVSLQSLRCPLPSPGASPSHLEAVQASRAPESQGAPQAAWWRQQGIMQQVGAQAASETRLPSACPPLGPDTLG